MSNGDGGRDAQRFLSFLSLPSATTVGKSTFSKLERTTTDSIHQLTEGYMRSNLFEEVRLTYANDPSFNFDAWKDSVLNQEPYGYMLPFISVSMDMGWQKRSSGRRYDSSSGHAFLVGIKTRKPVSMCLKSSFCSVCCYHMKRHNLEQEEVPEHECVANHQGSAGSMESAALIEMIESLYYSNQVAVSKVITDDDSKMKAQCKWSNKDFLSHHNHPPGEKKWLIVGSKQVKQKQVTVYRKDGLLRYPVPQPTFLAVKASKTKTSYSIQEGWPSPLSCSTTDIPCRSCTPKENFQEQTLSDKGSICEKKTWDSGRRHSSSNDVLCILHSSIAGHS